MNSLTQSKNATILPVLVALVLACFALSPQARAVCQEGCDAINNTFLGEEALVNNTTGFQNTATGWVTLSSNTTGTGNTATGASALRTNTTGNNNTATGSGALNSNTSGDGNTATGDFALLNNTTGNNNTAHGLAALETNETGNDNTAIGDSALLQSKDSNNIALGSISAKPVGVGAVCQRLVPTGERSGFADAHRDDGKRFVVRADEKLTAFLELESTLRTVTS